MTQIETANVNNQANFNAGNLISKFVKNTTVLNPRQVKQTNS